MDRERLEELVSGYLDRTLAPEEGEELFREMREQPEARRYLLLASHMDLALYDQGRAQGSRKTATSPAPRRWRALAVAACLLLGLSAGAIRYFSKGPEPELLGHIQTVTAGVTIQRGDIGDLCRVGEGVFAGEIVRVPAGGAVTAVGIDGTVLRAGPDSQLHFTSKSDLFLEKGSLRAEVTPQAENRPRVFLTPQAEARVLGTMLKLTATSGSTRLEVEQGKVRLKRRSDSLTVDVTGGHFAIAAPETRLEVRPLAAAQPPGFIVAPDGSPQGDGSLEKPWDLVTALAHPAAVKPGDTLWLREGRYPGVVQSLLTGTAEAPIVVRALPRERATVDGGIEAHGAWTTFREFEITNSSLQRGPERPAGLGLFGRGHKAVNLIIHDTGNPGIGFREEVGDGGEISGCLLWGNGVYAAGQPVGSAISAQNLDGVRKIRDTIAFRNFQAGIFIYAEKGSAEGFEVDGNVVFDHPNWGILATGGENPLRRLKVTDNFTFSRKTEASGNILRFGLLPQAQNVDILVKGNYFVLSGVDEAFHLFQWKDALVSGNTIIGGKTLVRWTPGAAGSRDWNANTYFTDGFGTFLLPTQRAAYPEWKAATGFDADSTFNPWAPGGTKVVVRPNPHDAGRAHVIVYNWDRRQSVDADLSGVLQAGARYVVRDAQNYYGAPVVQGSFDGKPVTLPVTVSAVASPVGACPHLQPFLRSTAPDFAVFVVERD